MAFISGEQMPPFEGYRGTKTLLGNRGHKKCLFLFLRTWVQANFYSGEQRISTNLT